jgi:hypothetical protein
MTGTYAETSGLEWRATKTASNFGLVVAPRGRNRSTLLPSQSTSAFFRTRRRESSDVLAGSRGFANRYTRQTNVSPERCVHRAMPALTRPQSVLPRPE